MSSILIYLIKKSTDSYLIDLLPFGWLFWRSVVFSCVLPVSKRRQCLRWMILMSIRPRRPRWGPAGCTSPAHTSRISGLTGGKGGAWNNKFQINICTKYWNLLTLIKTDDSVTQKCPTSQKLVIKIMVPFPDIANRIKPYLPKALSPHILLTLLYMMAAAAHQKNYKRKWAGLKIVQFLPWRWHSTANINLSLSWSLTQQLPPSNHPLLELPSSSMYYSFFDIKICMRLKKKVFISCGIQSQAFIFVKLNRKYQMDIRNHLIVGIRCF